VIGYSNFVLQSRFKRKWPSVKACNQLLAHSTAPTLGVDTNLVRKVSCFAFLFVDNI